MAIYRGAYYSASGCTGTKPGVQNATSWYLGAYSGRGAANLGTYVCKRLGSGWSIHADGRAADWGTSPYGVPSSWGWELANALRLSSHELGIQLIIFQDRLWSCTQPDAGWRPYSGDYHGHLHVEFIPQAAQTLTAAQVEREIGGGASAPGGIMALPRKGDQGDEVEVIQRMLVALGFDIGRDSKGDWLYDGDYGPKTEAAVLAFRQSISSDLKSGARVTPWTFYRLVRAVGALDGGKDGKDGRNGKDAAPEQIAAAAGAWLDEHREELRGEPGKTPTKIAISGEVTEVA